MHGFKTFHHYYFAKGIHLLTNHKPLAALVSKDVATLSQWLQSIMLCIHQYSMCVLYKLGPKPYIADCLPQHNHADNKHQEISHINLSIHAINKTVDIQIFTSIDDRKAATEKYTELQMLKRYIIKRLPHTKDGSKPELEK